VKEILPHDNADRLEIVKVKGWQCISSKGRYKAGDEAVYIPIDSLVPFELSEKLGITNYLTNKIKDPQGNIIASRVKTIKLRGVLSQGLIIDKEPEWKLGQDVREILKIEKYDPPETGSGGCALKSRGFTQYPEFTGFPQYTNIENFKNFPDVFEDGEEVVILEKIHGTNFRTGNIDPFNINWKYVPLLLKMRLLLTKYLGVKNPGFFVVGTHRTNLKRAQKDKFLNVYWRMAEKYQLKNKLNLGEEIFGEIYGYGIQKFFPYDSPFTQSTRFFDVMIHNQYLNWFHFQNFCEREKLPMVPVLYTGPFSLEKVIELASGKSTIADHMREGVIIKPTIEKFHPKLGRKILKYISDEYLLFKSKMEDKLLAEGKEPELDTFSH
jgi:RNA ligase (TIGR02306 family)